MREILFESSFQILAFGLFLAVPFFIMAIHFRDRRLWIASGVVSGLIVLALAVEWYVVTPREEVRQELYELAQIVENNDLEKLLERISSTRPDVLSRARNEMPQYDFSTCNIVSVHRILVDKDNPRKATADFLVRFHLSSRGYTGGGYRDVILNFEKEDDGKWRIVDYSHYNPTNRPDGRDLF